MVVIMKPGFTREELDHAILEMEKSGVKVMISKGSETTILGAEGNAAGIDTEKMESLPGIAVYMVREGDSLWDIGKRYYVPVSVIRQTNELSSDEVKAGDRILIVKNM